MNDELSKRQLRYLKEQERKGLERWEAMDEEEQLKTRVEFIDWFVHKAEIRENTLVYELPTLLDDAHVRARNLGLLNDPEFQKTWAELELDFRARIEEHE